jgi:hypothetical protein
MRYKAEIWQTYKGITKARMFCPGGRKLGKEYALTWRLFDGTKHDFEKKNWKKQEW